MKKPKPHIKESVKLLAPKTLPHHAIAYVGIAVLVILCYGAAIFNGFALDDFIVYAKNKFVQQGLAGIPAILSNDTFAGLTDANTMVLAGGRYRPFSVMSFAIEYQLWGLAPSISHAINIILYAICCCCLYRCLQYAWPHKSYILTVTLLFAALPIHSEVVINIKGRDDIFCFLFFLLSLLVLFKHKHALNTVAYAKSCLLFFLSLLSKETAITFLVIYPVVFLWLQPDKKVFKNSILLLLPAMLFMVLRQAATGGNSGNISTDVFNNPFINADVGQRLATVFYTWLLYLQKIFWPINLAYDYSFNQIPITNFSNVWVWVSLSFHVILTAWSFIKYKTQPWFAFAWLWYSATFSIVSNLLFNIGAPMADRFMFIPSLGIIMLVVLVIQQLTHRIKFADPKLRLALTVIILIPMAYSNYCRCANWKNNHALFLNDVTTVPQNAKAQLNAGLSLIEIAQQDSGKSVLSEIQTAMMHLRKGIDIYPQFIDGYLNMGVAYNTIGNTDSALWWWNKARSIEPNNIALKNYDALMAGYFLQQGLAFGVKKDFDNAIKFFNQSLDLDSTQADTWYNLGGAYYSLGLYSNAVTAWQKTLQINPNHQQAAAGYQAAKSRIAPL
jgi:cytochrome c-type biogenesis protein CcmH/NrfG